MRTYSFKPGQMLGRPHKGPWVKLTHEQARTLQRLLRAEIATWGYEDYEKAVFQDILDQIEDNLQ